MDRLRRLSWYDRIKTGPSPEDKALLQSVRDLSAQFQIPYWYKQVVWGRLDRYNGTGWIISKQIRSSKETFAVPGSLPAAELMLPEFLKGKLSLDEWRILIALHLVRFTAYTHSRMSRLLRKIALAPRGLFFLLLFYIPAAATGGLSGPVLYFPSPIFLVAALWIRRSIRRSLQRQEFELDRSVAEKLGIPQVLQVLEKVLSLDQIRIPTDFRFFYSPYVSYWNPSIRERTGELSSPPPADLPRSSRLPRMGLRGRVIITLGGFYFLGLWAGRGQYLRQRSSERRLRGHSLLSACCHRRSRFLDSYYRRHKHCNMDTPPPSLNWRKEIESS